MGEPVDERLKELIQELGLAINEALEHTARIERAKQAIREYGYEILLVNDVTVGYKRIGEDGVAESATAQGDPTKFILTTQDIMFLNALKVSIGEKET